MNNDIIFHAGTKKYDNKVVATGGRVLSVVGLDLNLNKAISKTYKLVEKISSAEDNLDNLAKHFSKELDQRNAGDNTDIGRLFTTGGVEKGQTMRGIPVAKHVSRPDTAVQYTGVASHQNDGTYVPGEYMESTNQQLGSVNLGGANAQGKYTPTESDYGIKSKQAYPNNRTVNKQDSYFGLVSGSIGAAVSPLIDMLRPSRKENVIGTLRPYQNPGTSVPQPYIFNPADKLPTTVRETTEISKNHMNVNANQNGGGYQVAKHQTAYTNRNETVDFQYSGIAGAGDGTTTIII